MAWGCVSASNVQDLVNIDGIMSTAKYGQIFLQHVILECVWQQFSSGCGYKILISKLVRIIKCLFGHPRNAVNKANYGPRAKYGRTACP